LVYKKEGARYWGASFFHIYANLATNSTIMNESIETIRLEAWKVLENCITPEGILASPQTKDNYRRIWSRDSMMAGITGIICRNERICKAHQNSILTLLCYQAEDGQIPSNVAPGSNPVISFGTLAGRVDATTWWIVGTCFAILNEENKIQYRTLFREGIEKALSVLNSWEMNHRGLIYTPLGGNWADEYLIQGYTLYDNCLRIWALRLAGQIYENSEWIEKAARISNLIQQNFYAGSTDPSQLYHPIAYKAASEKPTPWFWMCLNPQGYDTRWDMAGNALALMLNLHPEPEKLEEFVQHLANETAGNMAPAFHPVVYPGDADWLLLEKNHSYDFKNKPHHFHNGGCWPIMMGWLALGFTHNQRSSIPAIFLKAVSNALQNENPPLSFHEYWSGDEGKPGGVSPLGFTAAGFLLLHESVHPSPNLANWFPS
jgi:hypothetical protein